MQIWNCFQMRLRHSKTTRQEEEAAVPGLPQIGELAPLLALRRPARLERVVQPQFLEPGVLKSQQFGYSGRLPHYEQRLDSTSHPRRSWRYKVPFYRPSRVQLYPTETLDDSERPGNASMLALAYMESYAKRNASNRSTLVTTVCSSYESRAIFANILRKRAGMG